MAYENEERHSPVDARQLKPILISVDQFRSLIQCGRTKAFALVRDKQVRSVLIGRSRRVLLVDAERMVTQALQKDGQ